MPVYKRRHRNRSLKFAGKNKDNFFILEPIYSVLWKRRWRKKVPLSKEAFDRNFVVKFDKISSVCEKLNLCFTFECFCLKSCSVRLLHDR